MTTHVLTQRHLSPSVSRSAFPSVRRLHNVQRPQHPQSPENISNKDKKGQEEKRVDREGEEYEYDSSYEYGDESIHLSIAPSSLPVLQREYIRLLQSNNSLHSQLIRDSEQWEEWTREHAAEMRRVQDQYTALQYMLTQSNRKNLEQEKMIEQMKDKLNENKTESAAHIQMNTPTQIQHKQHKQHLPTDKHPVDDQDEVSLLSQQLSSLQQQLASLTSSTSLLRESETALIARLALRDAEIERLQQQLLLGYIDGHGDTQDKSHSHSHSHSHGSHWDHLLLNGKIRELQQINHKLLSQLDFLNAEHQQNLQIIAHYEQTGLTKSAIKRLEKKENEIVSLTSQIQQLQTDMKHKYQHKISELELVLFTSQERELTLSSRYDECIAQHQKQLNKMNEQLTLTSEALKKKELELIAQSREYTDKTQDQQVLHQKELHVTLSQLREKCNALTIENTQLTQRLEQLQHQSMKQQTEALSQQSLLEEDLVQTKKSLVDREDEIRGIRDHLLSLSAEKQQLFLSNKRWEGEVEITHRKAETLEKQNNFWREKYSAEEAAKRQAQQQISTIQQQFNECSIQLNQLQTETHKWKEDKKQSVAQSASLSLQHSQLEQQYKAAQEQIYQLQTQLSLQSEHHQQSQHVQQEQQNSAVHIDEVRTQLSGMTQRTTLLSNEVSHLTTLLSNERKEKSQLIHMLKMIDIQLVQIQEEFTANVGQKQTLEKKIEQMNQELLSLIHSKATQQQMIEELETSNHTSMQEKESLSFTIKNLQHSIDLHGLSDAQHLSDMQQMKQEAKQREDQLLAFTSREQHHLHKLYEAEKQIRELKHQLSTLQYSYDTLLTSKNLLSGQLAAATQKHTEMSALIHNLDRLNTDKETERTVMKEENQQLQQERSQLQHSVINMQEQIQRYEKHIENTQKQEKQWEADKAQLAQELQIAMDQLSASQQEVQVGKDSLQQHQQIINHLAADIQRANDERQKLLQVIVEKEQQLNVESSKLQTVTQLLSVKNEEHQVLMADIQLMLNENHSQQVSLQSASQQDQETKHRVQHLLNLLQCKEVECHSLEQEKSELLMQYKVSLTEIQRLHSVQREEEEQRVKLIDQASDLMQQQTQLTSELKSVQQSLTQSRLECESLSVQNHDLYGMCQVLKRETVIQKEELSEKKQQLLSLEYLQQTLDANRLSTQKHAAILHTQYTQATQQHNQLLQTAESYASQIQSCKEKIASLELLLATQRRDMFHKEEEMNKEKQQLQSSINDLTNQTQHQHQLLESLKLDKEQLIQSRDTLLASLSASSHTQATALLQEELKRLGTRADALTQEKQKLMTYLVRYEKEIKKMERQQSPAHGQASPSTSTSTSDTINTQYNKHPTSARAVQTEIVNASNTTNSQPITMSAAAESVKKRLIDKTEKEEKQNWNASNGIE